MISRNTDGVKSKLVIGDGTSINEFVNIRSAGGGIFIGKKCQLAQYVSLIAVNHTIDCSEYIIDAPHDFSKRFITLGDDVWVGAGAIILPGVEIGNGAVIGAGSIVTKNIPPNSVCVGNPAKVIRYRER